MPTNTATHEPAVSVRGLTKRYGDRTVVDGLDLDLPTGVVAGFVGPNGAGKTTTMAMLLGLVRPSAGAGTVLGEPIDRPAAYLPRVGAMVESPAFYPALSGVENLRLFATVGGHPTDRIPALLEIVGLADRGEDRYRTYSLGMKQRLGIAAALLGDPALLILDEPANGLDPQGVHEMRHLVGSLAHSGRTVLVSSHDLSELEQLCDWLVMIDAGRCRYQGPAEDFLSGTGVLHARPEHAWDAAALHDALAARGLHATVDGDRVRIDDGDLGGDELAAAVSRTAQDAGIVLVELTRRRASLEDRYLALVSATETASPTTATTTGNGGPS
jgi:ABC-2 type transport system ATP-binding protein